MTSRTHIENDALSLTHLGWFIDLVNGLLDVMVLIHVRLEPAATKTFQGAVIASQTEMDERTFWKLCSVTNFPR